MKAWIVVGVVLVAVAATGLFVVTGARRTGAVPATGSDADEPGATRGVPEARSVASQERRDLERRVADLEKEVRHLRSAIELLRLAGGEAETAARPGDPALRDVVRTVIEDEREERRKEREKREEERFSQRTREWLDAMDGVGRGLDDETRRALLDAWTRGRAEIVALFEEARTGNRDWSAVRQDIARINMRTDTEIRGLVDETQFSAYQRARADQPFWGDRPGPPPGP